MKHSLKPSRIALGALLACLAFTALPAFAAGEAQFPALSSSYLKTGDFIGTDHVRRITPGLNKDQVRLELGNPHFSEGIFGVREWDYAFNFYTGKANNDYVTCQFKVQFDRDYRVATTFWKGPDCAHYVASPFAAAAVSAPVAALTTAAPAPVAAAQTDTPPPVSPRRVVLASDGLFAFGKAGLNDLAAPGREKLDALISQLRQDAVRLSSVRVTGHTDRVGSSVANLALSRARAETVSTYLVKGGVNGQLARAHGVGESSPVVNCPGKQITPQLVACLQPNRRVEIESVWER